MVLVTQRPLEFEAGSERLVGRLVLAGEPAASPSLLFLHGAGKACKERSLFLAEALATDYGLSSFTFDFSGHGQSSGELGGSSLKKRRDEALAAITASGMSGDVTVLAFSMGGHIALELLPLRPIHGLVLFYPAVYSTAAFNLEFGGGSFTETIRQPKSWKDAAVWTYLKEFKGNFFLVTGENDAVIPPQIPALLWENTGGANRRHHLVVKDAPHLLLPHIRENKKLFAEVCRTIAEFSRT